MGSATHLLTLEEFRCRYAEEKPYYEYWFGEAVQKSVPTWLHTLLARILADALDRAGYASGPELELRIDPNWQPKPDVAAALTVEIPYPTKPIDVVAEVLSPCSASLKSVVNTLALAYLLSMSWTRNFAMPGSGAVKPKIWSAFHPWRYLTVSRLP
jgi:Uma2 family endonuclease